MAKHKYIKCDIYKRGVSVFIGSLDELHEWASHLEFSTNDRDFHRAIEDKVVDNPSFTPNQNDGQGIVFLTKYPETPDENADLEHELLHAVFHILDFCGVEYRYGGANEPYTYLLGYLTKNALETEGYEEIGKEGEIKNERQD